MGLKDRLGAAKRYLWSPLTANLLERGSDPVVRAGETARVVVDLEGANDGSCERVEVQLVLGDGLRVWMLGELPATPGHHELEVTVPAAAPPSSPWSQYVFKAIVHRTKGTPDDGRSPVRVIGSPDWVFWPEGPRAGSEDPSLAVQLDAETADAGGAVSGRVTGPPGARVTAGPVVDRIVGVEGKPNGERKVDYQPVAEAEADAGGAFRLELPVGVPPSLHNTGTTSVWWEVRATAGKATAYHRFALLDPDGSVDIPELRASGLLDLFS